MLGIILLSIGGGILFSVVLALHIWETKWVRNFRTEFGQMYASNPEAWNVVIIFAALAVIFFLLFLAYIGSLFAIDATSSE